MRKLRRLAKRLISCLRTEQDEDRLRAEIEQHLAFQIEDNLRAGLSPDEARRRAALKFGPVEAMKEEYRDHRGLPFAETLVQDARYAFRGLRKSPVFGVTVVLTLAFGIGVTTSIFTLARAVLMKSLAVANPAELYRVGEITRCCAWGGYSQERGFSIFSYDLYRYFRGNTTGFTELAGFQAGLSLFGVRRSDRADAAQSYPGEFVSGNYFTMFGLRAYAGRLLADSDDQPKAPPVGVMSYRLWQEVYGLDPTIIGSVFNINQKPFTVVGITPPSFFGDTLRSSPPDFFLPLNSEPFVMNDDHLKAADNHWLYLIGRVHPGTGSSSIEAQMQVELKQWLRSHWNDMSAADRAKFPAQTVFLAPGGAGITSMRKRYEHWLQILMMVAGLVLCIVCANVANLMLVRGLDRRQRVSLCMALGAPAARLVRQVLTESALLSFAGGSAGLIVAFVSTSLILRLAFPHVAGMAGVPISASPSIPVLLFAFVVSLISGIAFGIAPAWMATRTDPAEALRGVGRSTLRTGSIPRKSLVVCQTAFSLVLLVMAGLLTLTLRNLEFQKLGFAVDGRTILRIDPRLAGYRPEQLTSLYRRIDDSLTNVPGISLVAICTYSPLSNINWGTLVLLEGRPTPGPNDAASWDRITPGYFDAIGTPVLKGRDVSTQDTARSPRVAVINEAFARKFFKEDDPIGKHFGQSGLTSGQYEIIGVVQDARYASFDLDKPIGPYFFLPDAQHDFLPNGESAEEAYAGSHLLQDIVIVTRPGANLPSAQIRQSLASVDPNLPIISIRALNDQVAGQFSQQRLIARMTSLFGVLSLVLASIGLYGLTAYNAERRTTEIGVRLALGSSRTQAAGLIIRGSFSLTSTGLIVGLPLALSAGHFLGSQLYGLNPYNAGVIVMAVLTLGLSALLASLIPALRASVTSPLEALRAE